MSRALLQPKRLAIPGFERVQAQAYFLGRDLGVSQGPPGTVEAARSIARVWSSARPVSMVHQVHGAKILRAPLPHAREEADALVTCERNVPLAIVTADCAGVFYFSPDLSAVGLAHVGWRGAHLGLPGFMVEEMMNLGAKIAGLRVSIGPCLGPCCYEVGSEFDALFPGHVSKDRKGERRLDLQQAIRAQLTGRGVLPANLFASPLCTSCEREMCFSNRREGVQVPRNLSAIMLV